MRRVGKHLENLYGVGFEWAVEDQEPSEFEVTLDFISVDMVDLEVSQNSCHTE